MTVRLLTPDTIGKIAAGEVVERPASVVKELLENALDAGARRIAIEIRNGGNELIEVADDGRGMAAEDLPLAVRRHATSKLTAFEDLDRLRTLGFRGEALPSVGAVAALTIRTRAVDAALGAVLDVQYGVVGSIAPIGSVIGTTVVVRDLFANVPARRKFLRLESTEASYIARAVGAYALAYPEVAISLTSDGRRVLVTDGSGDFRAAAVGVHGPDLAATTLPLEPLDDAAAVPGVTVGGWVAQPSISRSHRQGLVFFVNGRWIQHRALGFALEEAYHSLLMVGRHPLVLVRVEVDPATVDVNVHPTKAEVKFVDERAICRAVQRAAHMALASGPHADPPELRFAPIPESRQRDFAAMPACGDTQRSLDANGSIETADTGPRATIGTGQPTGLPILRVLGQVASAYIIAEGPDGMYMIDQHAAHERVMYERILAQLAARGADCQPMLDPIIVELAPDQLAVFDRSRDELARIGFDIEPFGPGSVAIRAVPAIARGVDIAERFRLILNELADGGAGDSWLDAVAISAACHTSIRAGQALSLAEMRELVAELERTEQPRACGHGRPTMLRLTQGELARQFARR